MTGYCRPLFRIEDKSIVNTRGVVRSLVTYNTVRPSGETESSPVNDDDRDGEQLLHGLRVHVHEVDADAPLFLPRQTHDDHLRTTRQDAQPGGAVQYLKRKLDRGAVRAIRPHDLDYVQISVGRAASPEGETLLAAGYGYEPGEPRRALWQQRCFGRVAVERDAFDLAPRVQTPPSWRRSRIPTLGVGPSTKSRSMRGRCRSDQRAGTTRASWRRRRSWRTG